MVGKEKSSQNWAGYLLKTGSNLAEYPMDPPTHSSIQTPVTKVWGSIIFPAAILVSNWLPDILVLTYSCYPSDYLGVQIKGRHICTRTYVQTVSISNSKLMKLLVVIKQVST